MPLKKETLSMAPHSSHAAAVPLGVPQFRAAMSAVFLLILLGALDQMTVSVALPSIAASLGSFDSMAWVISGYMVASTVVTPLYGKFGDMYGRRRLLAVALAVFVLGSTLCALSPSLHWLIVARLVQGAGAGGLVALAQGVVADIVPLRERGRYQGYVSIVWAAASVLGPVAGGLLTQYLSWRWIFWINLPMGLAAWLMVRHSLRALPTGSGKQEVDWLGSALLMTGLVALLIPITRLGQGLALSDVQNGAWLLAAAVLLLVFWWQQWRTGTPILPLALLQHRVVIHGSMVLFICYFVFISLCLLVPLRLQMVAGWSPSRGGVFLMWLTLAVPAAVFLGGRWMTNSGQVRPLQRAGALLVAGGLCALAFVDPAITWQHACALIGVGVGLGLQMPTSLLMVQNAVPREIVGTATALTVFFRALGGAIGIAVLSSVVFALLQGGEAATAFRGAAALARGGLVGAVKVPDAAFRTALLVGAGLSLASVWISRKLPDTRLHVS